MNPKVIKVIIFSYYYDNIVYNIMYIFTYYNDFIYVLQPVTGLTTAKWAGRTNWKSGDQGKTDCLSCAI